ncbi:MAG: hypothetical protein JNJ71_13455 [Rubrivivax sp.]|nr:hypothetical protein [Rubrivivax sp.]
MSRAQAPLPRSVHTPAPVAPGWPAWARASLWVAAALALAAVFMAYLNPHLALDLATRVWACF